MGLYPVPRNPATARTRA